MAGAVLNEKDGTLNGQRERTSKPKVQWETQSLQVLVANMREEHKNKAGFQHAICEDSSVSRKSSDMDESTWYALSASSPSFGTHRSAGNQNGEYVRSISVATIDDFEAGDEDTGGASPANSELSNGSSVETWPPRMQRQKQVMIPAQSPRIILGSSRGDRDENSGERFDHVSIADEGAGSLVTRMVARHREEATGGKYWKPVASRGWGILIPGGGAAKKRMDAVAVGMLNDSFITYQAGCRSMGGKS